MAHDASEAPLEPSVSDGFAQVLDLRVGGALVARYHYGDHLPRPFLAPLIAPGGRQVTADPGPADHPHHRGVWTGHRDVDGVDHWTEFRRPRPDRARALRRAGAGRSASGWAGSTATGRSP